MNEENDFTVVEVEQENAVKVYSKRAILGFALFFAPIFAGVLLRQNLIDTNRKKEGNVVLLASIGFTILTILIVNSFERKTSVMTLLLNLGWGALLSEYFYKKYFSDNTYEYKKVWKPLFISIAILIPFLLAMVYAPAA